jgi:hypothetical protein
MSKKNITIDDLAITTRKGSDGVAKHFDANPILADHKERIEKLETEVKELKDLLTIN